MKRPDLADGWLASKITEPVNVCEYRCLLSFVCACVKKHLHLKLHGNVCIRRPLSVSVCVRMCVCPLINLVPSATLICASAHPLSIAASLVCVVYQPEQKGWSTEWHGDRCLYHHRCKYAETQATTHTHTTLLPKQAHPTSPSEKPSKLFENKTLICPRRTSYTLLYDE